jgi:hypothetical protein
VPARTTFRSLFLTEDDQAYVEAFLLVLAARFAIVTCFKRIAPWVLRIDPAAAIQPDPDIERRVRFALQSVGHRVPWTANKICLPNAIAAKIMLKRRGFASRVHLGVGRPADGELYAHAWLEAGGSVIIGEHTTRALTPLRREPAP